MTRPAECPTCGTEMDAHGYSGDVHTAKGVQGVDIAWDICPECGTIVDDSGNVITMRDQQHETAWNLYAMELGDWSIIPRTAPEPKHPSR